MIDNIDDTCRVLLLRADEGWHGIISFTLITLVIEYFLHTEYVRDRRVTFQIEL